MSSTAKQQVWKRRIEIVKFSLSDVIGYVSFSLFTNMILFKKSFKKISSATRCKKKLFTDSIEIIMKKSHERFLEKIKLHFLETNFLHHAYN